MMAAGAAVAAGRRQSNVKSDHDHRRRHVVLLPSVNYSPPTTNYGI